MRKNMGSTRPKEGRTSFHVHEGGEVREVKLPNAEKAQNTKVVRRVSLDLPEKAAGHLGWLETETGAMSIAEVIRDALKLYYGLVLEVKGGSSITLMSPSGEKKELKIFL